MIDYTDLKKIPGSHYNSHLTPLNWLVENFFEIGSIEKADNEWIDKIEKYLQLKKIPEDFLNLVCGQIYWELIPIWINIKIASLSVNKDFHSRPEVCLNDPEIKKKLAKLPAIPKVDPFGNKDSSKFQLESIFFHGKGGRSKTSLAEGYIDLVKSLNVVPFEHSDLPTLILIDGLELGADKAKATGIYGTPAININPTIIIKNGSVLQTNTRSQLDDIIIHAKTNFLRILDEIDLRCIRRCPKCFKFYVSGDLVQVTCGNKNKCAKRFSSFKAYRIKKNKNNVAKLLKDGK